MTVAKLSVVEDDGGNFADELPPGTQLLYGQYTITRFLNAGGFGITYLAKDSLDRAIVIKECFPAAFCRRVRTEVQARSRAHQDELASIVRLFVDEARALAKLVHPNIVGVHQVFEENNTAYMSLDFVEGRDLLDMVEDKDWSGDPNEITTILRKILDAIKFVHAEGMLHRDIAPDNILIEPDGNPILIDFGAAREQASKQSRVLSALRVVKDGYSPQEFYISGADQTASSDLYALGATFYHVIMRELPPDSQSRLGAVAGKGEDPYTSMVGRVKGYNRNVLTSIDQALALMPKDRVQSAADWLDLLDRKRYVVSRAVSRTIPTGGRPDQQNRTDARSGKSSKIGVLLGSAAVIAVVAGLAATQMDFGSSSGEEAALAAPSTSGPNVTDQAVAQDIANSTSAAPVAEVTPQIAAAGPTIDPTSQMEFGAATDNPVSADGASTIADAARPANTSDSTEQAAAPATAHTADGTAVTDEAGVGVSGDSASSGAAQIPTGPRVAYVAPPIATSSIPPLPGSPEVDRAALDGIETVVVSPLRQLPEPGVLRRLAGRADVLPPVDNPPIRYGVASAQIEIAPTLLGFDTFPVAVPTEARLSPAAAFDTRVPLQDAQLALFPSVSTDAAIDPLRASIVFPAQDGALHFAATAAERQAPELSASTAAVASAGALLRSVTTGADFAAETQATPLFPERVARALPRGVEGTERASPVAGDALPFTLFSVAVPAAETAALTQPTVGADTIRGQDVDLSAPAPAQTEPAPEYPAPLETNAKAAEAVADAGPANAPAPDTASPSSAPAPALLQSAWSVELPFALDSNVPVSSVNGVRIASLRDIELVVRQTYALDDETEIPVAFGVGGADGGTERRQVIVLPVVQTTALMNGMTFESRHDGTEWKTVLVSLQSGTASDLRPGDHIVAHLGSDRVLDERTSLQSVILEEAARGETSFAFAVRRNGQMWVTGFEYSPVAISN